MSARRHSTCSPASTALCRASSSMASETSTALTWKPRAASSNDVPPESARHVEHAGTGPQPQDALEAVHFDSCLFRRGCLAPHFEGNTLKEVLVPPGVHVAPSLPCARRRIVDRGSLSTAASRCSTSRTPSSRTSATRRNPEWNNPLRRGPRKSSSRAGSSARTAPASTATATSSSSSGWKVRPR